MLRADRALALWSALLSMTGAGCAGPDPRLVVDQDGSREGTGLRCVSFCLE